METPLIFPLISLIGGIVLSFKSQIEFSVIVGALFASFLVILLSRYLNRPLLSLLSVFAGFFFLGLLTYHLHFYSEVPANHVVNFVSNEKIALEGVVSEIPLFTSERTEFVLSASYIYNQNGQPMPVQGKVFAVGPPNMSVDYGHYVHLKTRLRKPTNFENPGRFDYAKFLFHRGITVRCTLNRETDYVVIRKVNTSRFMGLLSEARRNLRELINQRVRPPNSAIIQALILGDTKEIPPQIRDKFNATGVSHILAISGFHVGIVTIVSFYLFRSLLSISPYLLLRFDVKKISLTFAMLPVVVYTAIAGAKVTVIRASLMIILFILAAFLGRLRDIYNVLFMAALIILLVAPHSLFESSFQLSFVAVLSIVYLTNRIMAFIPIPTQNSESPRVVQRMVHSGRTFLSVTIAATLGTMPLLLYHFQRLPLVGIPANLVVVPILGLITVPLCLFVLFTYPFSTSLASIFLDLAAWFVDKSLLLVDFFSALPSASLFIPPPKLVDVILLYIVIIGFTKTMDLYKEGNTSKMRCRFALLLTILFIAIFVFHYTNPLLKTNRNGSLRITVLDVGQGNSVLITTPEGKHILLDGGGYHKSHFDIGRSVVVPYLLHSGITSLDVVALSHPHPDHYGGLLYVVENFPVKEFWYNGDEVDDEMFHILKTTVVKKKLYVRILKEQRTFFEFGGISIRVLNPSADSDEGTINDRALVFQLLFKDCSVFLPSDISQEVEKRIVYEHPDIRASVLVVSHHGSHHATSDELLKTLKPKIAIISTGRDNPFGFPHVETLTRLAERGVRVLRTDLHGAVTITSDGSGVDVETYKKEVE
ncbi:MAG: DNA internalization-related competence protein ComEC/Rec2 [Syntrophales bacterium]|nr:DNA internalization-related competence protein ComEC/Rec2 [Syntrophales bacterium]